MIFWDLRSAADNSDLLEGKPPGGLLSRPEEVYFSRLRTARRREEWLLGRWTAKCLCLAWLAKNGQKLPATNLTIAPAADGSPYVLAAHLGRLPITLSITHRHQWSACALIAEPNAFLGVDLEFVEPKSNRFVDDFFTESEIEQTNRSANPNQAVVEIWSLKEAVLKALRLGLTVDTRKLNVRPRAMHYSSPSIQSLEWGEASIQVNIERKSQPFSAWVRDCNGYVLCLAWNGKTPNPLLSDTLRGYSPCLSKTD